MVYQVLDGEMFLMFLLSLSLITFLFTLELTLFSLFSYIYTQIMLPSNSTYVPTDTALIAGLPASTTKRYASLSLRSRAKPRICANARHLCKGGYQFHCHQAVYRHFSPPIRRSPDNRLTSRHCCVINHTHPTPPT